MIGLQNTRINDLQAYIAELVRRANEAYERKDAECSRMAAEIMFKANEEHGQITKEIYAMTQKEI